MGCHVSSQHILALALMPYGTSDILNFVYMYLLFIYLFIISYSDYVHQIYVS
jgi:hypothetical protein